MLSYLLFILLSYRGVGVDGTNGVDSVGFGVILEPRRYIHV